MNWWVEGNRLVNKTALSAKLLPVLGNKKIALPFLRFAIGEFCDAVCLASIPANAYVGLLWERIEFLFLYLNIKALMISISLPFHIQVNHKEKLKMKQFLLIARKSRSASHHQRRFEIIDTKAK